MNTATAMPFQYIHRTNGIDGLSDAWLKARVPSLFATGPVQGVSEKYGFLPTTAIVKAMREEGFVPTEVRHYMRRNKKALPFTKHMIRFRIAGDKPQVVGDVVPQILFVNSHDRSSRAELYGGLYRLICSNGMVVSESGIVAPVVVKHLTNPVEELLRSVEQIIKQHRSVADHVKEMRAVRLNEKQQLAFAREAATLRHHTRKSMFNAEDLLKPRRTQDAGDSLWLVFNRVQENFMKGGVPTITAGGRVQVTRPVESMKADMRINAGLWEMAMNAIAKARGSAREASKA